MGRIAAKISKERFLELWRQAVIASGETMPDHPACGYANSWVLEIGKIGKDVAKVHFDWENSDWWTYNDQNEVQVNEDGLVYLGISAGGDWEYPVVFIIYLDQNGKTFRGYVPTEGNAWNHDTKEAFGNDDKADTKFMKKWKKKKGMEVDEDDDDDYPDEVDASVMMDDKLIYQDIRDRIKVKD